MQTVFFKMLKIVTKSDLDKEIKGEPTDVARAEEIFKLI